MNEEVRDLIKKEKPHVLKYKKYVVENPWSTLKWNEIGKPKSNTEVRKEEFNLQNNILTTIVNRLKATSKKTKGSHHLKIFKDYYNEIKDLISLHIERAESYTFNSDITSIESTDLRADEIDFHRHLHLTTSSLSDTFSALDIRVDDEQAAQGIQWLDTQKATLAMHETLVTQYPEIKTKLDSMGINFDSPPPATIHILNENPPVYNPDKNYWEQDKDVLQYYVDEYKKIDQGITIDGYYIDGWLYFHFNFFVTSIPTTRVINGIKENKDVNKVPELRDNEILITDYFIKSKKEGTMSLIAATRRAAKTTLNSSRIARAKVLNKKTILCAGGSSEDLNHIHKNLDTHDSNVNPAFYTYYLAPTEDGRGKTYGIKTKSNKSKITSNIFILNLEGGTKKDKKESLAGFTPDEFILDEAMKFPFKHQLEALEPALWGSGILRCSVLITGTGGDEDLAVDAIKMLNNPVGNKVTLMDWNELERDVPKDLITWRRKDFGLFLPTQMCVKHPKIKSNLADYLGIKSETLSKIPLWTTDWEKAKEAEEKERLSKINERASYVRLLAYHPFDPEEIFLSGKISPFSDVLDEAKKHRDYLVETGKWDNRRKLFRDSNGKIQSEQSKEDLIPFPFSGSNQDAPFNIIEEPDQEKSPKYYYVASADFYKQETSTDTDSVGTVVVYKYPIVGDKSGGKIVATYAARPKRYKDFNEKVLLLLEYYNAICLPENEDLGVFQTFLESKHLEEYYLEKHIDFNGTLSYSEGSARKWGWTAKQSKQKLISIFRRYLEEEVEVENDNGELVTVKRIQTIDDIYMLSEILSFNENGNFDRISGALGGVGLLHFLKKNYIYPSISFKNKKETEEEQEVKIRKVSFFQNNNRRRVYRRR